MNRIDYHSLRCATGFDRRVRFLVLHYTALDFAASVAALTGGNRSVHYLIPDPADPAYRAAGFGALRVFGLVAEGERAWHAGDSHWRGRDGLNDTSIGIELVNRADDRHFPPFAPAQIAAVIGLARDLLMRYPEIDAGNVVGHGDIAYLRRRDPGPRFPWHRLHRCGIGAWPRAADVARWRRQFTHAGLPDAAALAEAFVRYGYAPPAGPAALRALVSAFQMHFRPACHDGRPDTETCAILFALNDRHAPIGPACRPA